MANPIKITKGEKRQHLREKEQRAPKGASLAGQIKRAQTSMYYAKRRNVTKTGNRARIGNKK
ncbi:MAG: hypothetical protein Q8P32_03950 [Candidatus Komeilibacteria bacterium]|nr:hypothetical protein [Candidatus Komeilibacteria bacterium]